eukprot:1055439-Prymnesium_polylepis.1
MRAKPGGKVTKWSTQCTEVRGRRPPAYPISSQRQSHAPPRPSERSFTRTLARAAAASAASCR